MDFRHDFGCEIPQLKETMGEKRWARVQNERNHLRGQDTGVTLQFYTYDNYADSASMLNESILCVT